LLPRLLKIPIEMFNFLKKMFGRDGASVATNDSVAAPTVIMPATKVAEKPVAGGVEVATLSLRAILEKLPPDLKAIINQLPGPEVTIVLPINTIVKQLSTGAVKMSLASLLRQAPTGTFRKAPVEDKQMVDVPLSEIFKSVDPRRLGRRSDQRRYDVPDDATGLFGKDGATRSVTAAASATKEPPKSQPPTQPVKPAPDAAPAIEAPIFMRMPGTSPVAAAVPASGIGKPSIPAPTPSGISKIQAPSGSSQNGELVLSFVELAAGWPDGIRSELSCLPGDTKLVVPAEAVSPGLQKGKVAFPWSQVSRWLKPGMSGSVSIPEDFELVFPLKIMAPAFVAATGASKRREGAEINSSLPDFFGPSSGHLKMPSAAVPAPTPATEPTAAVECVPAATEAATPPFKLSVVCEAPMSVETPATPSVQTNTQPTAVPAVSPAEIVVRACDLPGISGAVIGLEEGLVVAQKLPEGFVADTFAAFMPQIFGRLERYTSEMQLGGATAIIIQSAQGPCRIARHGKIYFGTIGRAGEKLPDGLDLLSEQLASHNR
jgi:predicted regulator of Ras-like GTPase activity (Roadblock/LC7/MglB family)